MDKATIRRRLFRTTIFLGGFGFVAGSTLFALAWFTVSIPDPNAYVNSQSTIIQYSNGDEIGRIGTQNRQILPIAQIPINMRNAVLAAEDRKFYSNQAFSFTGIARALLNNLKSGDLNAQGGSTITQQYAKTAFLTSSRTIERKIKELVIAMKLENALTKDQIFENYLNTIYFGRGSYGVQTASQQYFNRNVDQLNLSQTAVIASILRAPGYYDPSLSENNLVRLQNRFQYVINGMLAEGWITQEQADNAKFPTVTPRVTSGSLSGPKGHVISQVQRDLGRLGFTEEQLLEGGLVIRTTLVQKAQQSAVDAVTKLYPKKAPENLRIGLIAIRPGTGEIIAMYGGRDYLERQLNDATQSIALAGSTFKPFALIAGLEAGIPLTSMWNGDSPQIFDDLGKPYTVSNYGDNGWGQIDLLTATQKSINTIFVPLGMMAGMDKVGPNKGVLYEATPQTQQVFSQEVMADLTYALKSVVNGGTGSAALALGRPAAGKTGTSQSNASAWFSGYTPQLAASVAFFRDSASESLNGIGGLTSVTGGTFPARIWAQFMKGALKGEPVMTFPAPSNIGGLEPIVMTSGGVQTPKE